MNFPTVREFDALRNDVNLLFATFGKLESVRFEDFCSAWKELNFSAVFCCTQRNTEGAKMRIAERLMRISSEFLAPEASFLHRVAAVYCLYSVYFKQLTPQKVKIRMTPVMWRDLIGFLEVCISHQHLDIAYVIVKLRMAKAFMFTAIPKHLSFGTHEFMLGIEGCPLKQKTTEVEHDYVHELVTGKSFLQNLTRIHKDYEEVRNRLLNESKEEERENVKKNLFVSDSEFHTDVQSAVSSFSGQTNLTTVKKPRDWSKKQRPVLTTTKDPVQQPGVDASEVKISETDKETSARASKLKRLKEKSFKSMSGESDEESVTPAKEARKYFKRSAMVEPLAMSAWSRTSRAKHVQSYKMSEKVSK